jgi:2-keto-4-pentenoate hydratase/2-oxohepta-3-ene-1,7-dioic acid hydratase in catechol pathway
MTLLHEIIKLNIPNGLKGKVWIPLHALGHISSKANIEYPPKLDIVCKVNGDIRQKFNTSKLIFDISDLSKGLTLRAGGIILTGTPAGVGLGLNHPIILQKSDILKNYIEKIGTLVNYVD